MQHFVRSCDGCKRENDIEKSSVKTSNIALHAYEALFAESRDTMQHTTPTMLCSNTEVRCISIYVHCSETSQWHPHNA